MNQNFVEVKINEGNPSLLQIRLPLLAVAENIVWNNTGFNVNTANPENNNSFGMQIVNVDADWDDEFSQVELRVEIKVTVSGMYNSAQVNSVGFQAIILAAVAA